MATRSPRKKVPRIKKAPTVREQMESSSKVGSEISRKRTGLFSKIGNFLRPIFSPVLRPIAPIGRLLLKALNWLIPRYFINAWRELRFVSWPSRVETWRLTGAVFVFAVVFGALVAVVDKGLDEFFKKVILR
ncbi:MAG TPA: preprotein translocase subunit SecE [Candidatus Saccharimonadales bacterium]|nr:preprotein translocase subunit SecE [Candidatus Saccharimonadales bacterium]